MKFDILADKQFLAELKAVVERERIAAIDLRDPSLTEVETLAFDLHSIAIGVTVLAATYEAGKLVRAILEARSKIDTPKLIIRTPVGTSELDLTPDQLDKLLAIIESALPRNS